MAERLCEAIAAEAALTGREVLWDLYCGVGTIGLFLAEKAAKVHGFESNPAAVAAARKNAGHLGDHCRYHHVLLPDGIRREIPMPDVIVVDPPKSGMDAALVDALNALPARKILYVSCDPATQARDLARMSSSWRLIRSLPFDMFPYTPHVENLIVLEPSALSRPASS
jgi:tRNA/tmRNA/rRNA uracil-C5-methylase (TrmA/RlmC/RlmD family)